MKTIEKINNVLFFKKNIAVYSKVDKFVIIPILSFLFFSIKSSAQSVTYVDSITRIYNSLEEGIPKIKLVYQLFKIQIYKDLSLTKKYADEQLNISKKINYTKGEGTAYRDLSKYYRYNLKPNSARYYFKASVKNFTVNGSKERLCKA